jgi:Septum formation initiator
MRRVLKLLQNQAWFPYLGNKYLLATLGFVVWMTFLDLNSWRLQAELNREIERLEASIRYYEENLAHDQQRLKELTTDPARLEKFAREKYWMHRPGEEVYLIDWGEGEE